MEHPKRESPQEREPIPPAYASELQTVFNALNDLKQVKIEWDCGTTGVGVLVSDSLMFQRGEPSPSDAHLSQVYGLALPLFKRGMPVTPVQLENVTIPRYLDGFRVLLLSYHGQKPLSPEVDRPLADWVKGGGRLVVCDDDGDPYNQVRDWWNTGGRTWRTPREHLFEALGIATSPGADSAPGQADESASWRVGKGDVFWWRDNPASMAATPEGDLRLLTMVKQASERARLEWRETNYLLLRRGPYVIAAGLDESVAGAPKTLRGRFVNLFDPELAVCREVKLSPASRTEFRAVVEGVANTPALVLLRSARAPRGITLAGEELSDWRWDQKERLVWVRFGNTSHPRELSVSF